MKVTIKGEPWKIVTVARFADDRAGECDKEARTIRVLRGLSGPERMRIVLHELLHAYAWSWSEARVDEASTTMAHVLRRLGARWRGMQR